MYSIFIDSAFFSAFDHTHSTANTHKKPVGGGKHWRNDWIIRFYEHGRWFYTHKMVPLEHLKNTALTIWISHRRSWWWRFGIFNMDKIIFKSAYPTAGLCREDSGRIYDLLFHDPTNINDREASSDFHKDWYDYQDSNTVMREDFKIWLKYFFSHTL